VVGMYYYMRIANAMLMRKAADDERLPVSFGMRAALAITAAATLVIGIFPNQLFQLVNWSLNLYPPSLTGMLR
jgi:NADH:ubiquinone oxidoreductase subunit 2 (subunit N)